MIHSPDKSSIPCGFGPSTSPFLLASLVLASLVLASLVLASLVLASLVLRDLYFYFRVWAAANHPCDDISGQSQAGT